MKRYIPVIILFVLLIGIGTVIAVNESGPGKYDAFAQCITDSGTKFFGAFWCPHCKAAKAMFGKSAKLLPYVECATPNGAGQTQICIDNNIKGYPTWIFPDGTRITGEQTMETLSEKTNCPIYSDRTVQ